MVGSKLMVRAMSWERFEGLTGVASDQREDDGTVPVANGKS